MYCSIKSDIELEKKLTDLSEKHPREGFWKCYARLRNNGEIINHKRLHRVYKSIGLPMRRKVKKRLPKRVQEPLKLPETFGSSWSMDFMHDSLSNKTKFKSFNIIDDYNREVLYIDIDYSLKQAE